MSHCSFLFTRKNFVIATTLQVCSYESIIESLHHKDVDMIMKAIFMTRSLELITNIKQEIIFDNFFLDI